MILDTVRSDPFSIRTTWLLLALILLASAALRLNLLDIPLERDEGEYAYAGQRILQGDSIYRDIYTMKLPGTHVAYALIMKIFGQSARGIHLGLLLLTGLNQLLLFAIGRRLSGTMAGLAACASFGLLALSPSVLGASANTEHFVLAPALTGVLLSLRAGPAPGRWAFVIPGLFFGIAILMKQHGAIFAIAAAVAFAIQNRGPRRVLRAWGQLALGTSIPLLLMLLILAMNQAVDSFLFWSVEYSLRYVSGLEPALGWFYLTTNFGAILKANPAVWALALLGLVVVLRRGRISVEFASLVPLTVLSVLAVIPGFYFRPHYFLITLPATTLLFGVGLTALGSRIPDQWRNTAPLGLILFVALLSIAAHRDVLFRLEPDEISRRIYGRNPFVESTRIAGELASRSGPEDTIAIVGSEPQILFHARRKSATSYIYTYPLMESHPFARQMQDEMIAQIETGQPRLLVFVNVATSWLATAESDQHILNWVQQYWGAHYRRVGVIELPPEGPSRFRWGDNPAAPQGDSWLVVFERES